MMIRIKDAQFFSASATIDTLPGPDRSEVAFAGRSNVGKSSLINTVLERKNLVRTSRTPGATRTINLFQVDIQIQNETSSPFALTFADLPGYGFAKRDKQERKSWGALIESYLKTRAGLSLVVVLVDVRRGLEEDDIQLLEFLRAYNRPYCLVATKVDLVPLSQRKPLLAKLQSIAKARVIGFSATAKLGRDDVWREILHSFKLR